jgi:hypothetical protein
MSRTIAMSGLGSDRHAGLGRIPPRGVEARQHANDGAALPLGRRQWPFGGDAVTVGDVLQHQVTGFGLRQLPRIEAAQQEAGGRSWRHRVIELDFAPPFLGHTIARPGHLQDQRGGRLLGGAFEGEFEAGNARQQRVARPLRRHVTHAAG